ncbi:hypothetical protein K2173_001805 [Erythroxylum novogranatense]|uniref:BZIP domain-containing protein n=1 Tax=Erythroxylum novogranatense TaxID=1862640 RepID=A0AAV8SJQ1_9ROSI|nr:hypothetical protein K2173_001805 [Erythroxylum novogranatense]
MAQLPPKIPNILPTWPEFSGILAPPKVTSTTTTRAMVDNMTTTTAAQNPSWVDEFLDFSSSRRGTHRRSVSDSITFLEAPMLDECHGSDGAPTGTRHSEFDKFDDEQFMSMFAEDVSNAVGAPCSSNTSSPSDHNSFYEYKETVPSSDQKQHKIKNETDEVQSQCQSNTQAPASNTNNDRIVDPKRVKRILANRQSAQRSRVRKLQYISELERSVTSLQAEVLVLSPRVAFLDQQRLLLNVDNSALKQRIAALAQDKIFKDAHQEALKSEIERLRQVYHQQSLKKMENGGPSPSPLTTDSSAASDEREEQLLFQV